MKNKHELIESVKITDELCERIGLANVREMKNPVVIIHEDDVKLLTKYVESSLQNTKVAEDAKITFMGIPLERTALIKQGEFYVIDKPIYKTLYCTYEK